jgi:crotonobetaine/carnitine-CoA ligase
MDAVGCRTLQDILEYRAATQPDRPFLLFDDIDGDVAAYSYAQFDLSVNRTAHMLRSLGIGGGDKINLHLGNCVEFLQLWFAAAKIGAVIMPTNVAATAAELEYLIDHSECRLIFTQSGHLDVARQVQEGCARVEATVVCGGSDHGDGPHFDTLQSSQSDQSPGRHGESASEVGILYTSGTTSRPKGVLVTNANYIYAGETVAKALCLSPEDRHLVVMPLFHGNAQYYSTMSTMVTGASMVLSSRFSASRFFDQAIRHQCTVASLFSAPVRMLLAQERRDAHGKNSLRAVLFAQNLTEDQLSEWHERFHAPLLQLWGMTETMGPPLINPMHFRRDNMSMGLPVMGYRVRLVDDEGRQVARGETGQIVVAGEPGRTLMKGYFKNPQATEETIRDGWLWSGDNARQDEHGYFYFVDRAKDMIKRAGENVAASEVEAVILTHPQVFDCAVVGVPDPIRDEAIVAVVVLVEEGTVDGDAIIAWCKERLASFRVPEQVAFRRTLPRTSVGKIQKHLLRAELISENE